MSALFIRVPYYIGAPKRDPNLEDYPGGRITFVLVAMTANPKVWV